MGIQGFVILALGVCAVCLIVLLRKAAAERPLHLIACQKQIMEMQIAWAKAHEDYKISVSAKVEELRILMLETQRLRDRKDADRDQQLQNIQAVLTTKLRFTP